MAAKEKLLKIVNYKPEYANYFEQFNKAWIEENYVLEPIDKCVLENPKEAIIDKGGSILFIQHGEKIIGTVALKFVEDGIFELTKMAVDINARGIGAGKQLCIEAIKEAKKQQAKKVILYSNTRQSTAIKIYRKIGFTEIPVEQGKYERANIKMEFLLQDNLSENNLN